MAVNLYDYVNSDGVNEFKEWSRNQEKCQLGKLNSKIDMLKIQGAALRPLVLTDSPVPGINKLRIKGNVQLRPLLCSGPISRDVEFTFLKGAKEVASRWVPSTAPQDANSNKQRIINNPEKYRVEHVRVSP